MWGVSYEALARWLAIGIFAIGACANPFAVYAEVRPEGTDVSAGSLRQRRLAQEFQPLRIPPKARPMSRPLKSLQRMILRVFRVGAGTR